MLLSYTILLDWVAFHYMMEWLQRSAKYKAGIFNSQISLFGLCLQIYTGVELMMHDMLKAEKG